MALIHATQNFVHRRVNFANGLVMNHTYTGLLEERIICVGQ